MSCVLSLIFRVVQAKNKLSDAFRRLLAAISEAKAEHYASIRLDMVKCYELIGHAVARQAAERDAHHN